MARIPLTFQQVDNNYREQKDLIMRQVQDSNGRDRNMAFEDMEWWIEHTVQVQALNFMDLLTSVQENGRPPQRTPSTNHFALVGKAGRIEKFVNLRGTPLEYTRMEQQRQEQEQRTQARISRSLQEANNHPERLWMRFSSPGENGRPRVIAFPILACFKNSKGKVFIVTDNYEGQGYYELEGNRAIILNKDESQALVALYNRLEPEASSRFKNKTLTKVSEAEIHRLTDFSVFIEDFSKALPGLVGFQLRR